MEKKLIKFDNKYSVSTEGKIYSLKGKKKELIGKVNRAGYRQILINHNGIRKYLLAHRIVAESFLENLDLKRTVNHKNCIKTDNRLENLEWATDSENLKHARDNGLASNNKITMKIANKIRADYKTGNFTTRSLGVKYKISSSHIAYIILNKRWSK